jgi:uncharacterized protein YndB with AHSA1/START domain
MTLTAEAAPPAERELIIDRLIDAPREALYRCWTEPELLKQWFAPAPVTTPIAELDVRPGGENFVVMRLPDGQEIPNRGVYLEVAPNEKLVFTDAYASGWAPRDGHPFMTVILTFEDAGPGRTHYLARVRHWTGSDRERHEQMGFHSGWGQCADQLAALAKTL